MSTWVLLRGLTREARHWGGFPAILSQQLNGCPVLTMDLPGNGELNHLQSPTRVEAMADFCHDELRRRGIDGPVNVLAMSLGAMVAVAWAQRHPPDLRAAVLINTSLRPFSAFHQRLRPRNYLVLLKLALLGSPQQWEETVLRLTSRHATTPREALLMQWLRYRAERPVGQANALRQLWAANRYAAPRTAPPLPLLVLSSARDQLVEPQCSTVLAQAWRCSLHTHPTAGHDLPLDDGPWVARHIAQWLHHPAG